jgi:membrane protease YdiL (CAAX protease family)
LATIETIVLVCALSGLIRWWHVPLNLLGIQNVDDVAFLRVAASVTAPFLALDVLGLIAAYRRPVASEGPVVADSESSAGVIGLLIVSAVWEELAFRATPLAIAGTGPYRLTPLASGLAAAALLGFGAQHVRRGPQGVAYALIYGALFTAAYVVSQSIGAVIIAHFAGNAFAICVSRPILLRRIASYNRIGIVPPSSVQGAS